MSPPPHRSGFASLFSLPASLCFMLRFVLDLSPSVCDSASSAHSCSVLVYMHLLVCFLLIWLILSDEWSNTCKCFKPLRFYVLPQCGLWRGWLPSQNITFHTQPRHAWRFSSSVSITLQSMPYVIIWDNEQSKRLFSLFLKVFLNLVANYEHSGKEPRKEGSRGSKDNIYLHVH